MRENHRDLVDHNLDVDQAAFAALFDQYKNLVYKTAYLMMGSAEDAEDILQEVFLQVHRSLSTFDPGKGAFTTWLHRITVNHCLNRRRKRRFAFLSLDSAPSGVLSDERSPVEERLGDQDAIQQALGRLSQKLRAVIVLRYYWELSYLEISQALGIPVGTVKSRLDLGLKTLRTALEKGSAGYSGAVRI